MVYRRRAFLKKHGEGWHCVKRVDAAGDGNVQRAGDGGKKKPQHVYVSVEESIRADEEDRCEWARVNGAEKKNRKKERQTFGADLVPQG